MFIVALNNCGCLSKCGMNVRGSVTNNLFGWLLYQFGALTGEGKALTAFMTALAGACHRRIRPYPHPNGWLLYYLTLALSFIVVLFTFSFPCHCILFYSWGYPLPSLYSFLTISPSPSHSHSTPVWLLMGCHPTSCTHDHGSHYRQFSTHVGIRI